MSGKSSTPAMAYLRTSSAANVGADKDSDKRQRVAIEAFARLSGFEIVAEFYDQAVSGADAIDGRPGFVAMLKHVEASGARTIIVETANRFARDLMVQEVGHASLRKSGIELIAADSPTAFLDDTPTAVLVRQVLGAIAQFDKAMIVSKLRGARERLRKERGKCEGRKTRVERLNSDSEAAKAVLDGIALATRLHRASPKTGKRRSLRTISSELAAAGYLNERGRPFDPKSVGRMLGGADQP
jgi:DNA invertase Pin-like site-specific DNA recombinase